MKKPFQWKVISEKGHDFLISKKDYINNETNMGVFLEDEKIKMQAAFREITGKDAPTNCNGLCPTVLKVLRNYIAWYETNHIPTVEEFTEAKSLTDYTKKELVEMYPGIDSKLKKADFIAVIENGEG